MFCKKCLPLLIVMVAFVFTCSTSFAEQKKFTEWGWPLPYEKVSQKSIDWLKAKGWWPIPFGVQPEYFPVPVMKLKGFLKERGIEENWMRFFSGPETNEAAVAGQVITAASGNFPYTSLLSRDMPIKGVVILNSNWRESVLVPADSKLKSLKDLKGMTPTPSFGIVTGSSCEFFFQKALTANNLEFNIDVILKPMPPPEMLLMPKGITGVVIWDPWVTEILERRKNGKEIDNEYPYNMAHGVYYVRKELIDNVPDVVQALVDSVQEAVLYMRYDLEGVMNLMVKDPSYKSFEPLVLKKVIYYNFNLYKPTQTVVLPEFWGTLDSGLASWLKQIGRLKKDITKKDYEDSFDKTFINKTFAKLGWVIPQMPPWIPKGWKGELGKIPYPEYYNPTTLKDPQVFPEKSDLAKPWYYNGKWYNP